MKLSNISRMTRSSDPKYPTVRNAYIGALAAGAVAALYDLVINESGLDLVDAGSVVVASFLGWAIARELDPDHPVTALVALAGSAFFAIWSLPYLLLSAVALGSVRLLVGSVGGGGPTRLDLMVLVAMAGYAGWHAEGWLLALTIVVGIVVAGGREDWPWALLAGGLAVSVGLIFASAGNVGDESFVFLALPFHLISLALLAIPSIPTSRTDIGKRLLDPWRLRAGRLSAGIAVLAAVVLADLYGLTNLGPLTAAVIATALSAGLGLFRAKGSVGIRQARHLER